MIFEVLVTIRIPPRPPTIARIVVAVVVVNQTRLGIVIFAAPLNRLDNIPFCRDLSVGRVGVNGTNEPFLPVQLADVIGQVPAARVPHPVLADGKGSRGTLAARIG